MNFDEDLNFVLCAWNIDQQNFQLMNIEFKTTARHHLRPIK